MGRGFDCVFSLNVLSELKFGGFGGKIGGIYIESTISSRVTVADPPRRYSTRNAILSIIAKQGLASFLVFQ